MAKEGIYTTSIRISEEMRRQLKYLEADRKIESINAAVIWGLQRVIENGGTIKDRND